MQSASNGFIQQTSFSPLLNLRKFWCEYSECTYYTLQKSNLEPHYKTAQFVLYLFINPFNADCFSTFSSDERPFACLDCGFRFKLKTQLRKHSNNQRCHERWGSTERYPSACLPCRHSDRSLQVPHADGLAAAGSSSYPQFSEVSGVNTIASTGATGCAVFDYPDTEGLPCPLCFGVPALPAGGGSLLGALDFHQSAVSSGASSVEVNTSVDAQDQDQVIDSSSTSQIQIFTSGGSASNSSVQNQFDSVKFGDDIRLFLDLDVSKYRDMTSPDYYLPPDRQEHHPDISPDTDDLP